jgi:glutathione S-transferase
MTKGLVRELRIRWMLEELGVPYEPVSFPHPEIKKDEYKKKQPFGQVPYFESGDFHMFETGAILIHLAEKHKKFLPTEESARAHTLQWMFAAQTSVEPFLFYNFMVNFDPDASEASKVKAKQIVMEKLGVLSKSLSEKEFFTDGFTIAEIVMTSALRNADSKSLLVDFPNLTKYLRRMEARPAFQRALNEHVKLYEEKL